MIFQMVAENPTWGAPRIHGELLMLGFDVSERTISRWMKRAVAIRNRATFGADEIFLAGTAIDSEVGYNFGAGQLLIYNRNHAIPLISGLQLDSYYWTRR